MWIVLAAGLACSIASCIPGDRFATRADAGSDDAGPDAAADDGAPLDGTPHVGAKAYVMQRTGAIHRVLRATDGTLSDPVEVYAGLAAAPLLSGVTDAAGTRLYVPVTATRQLLHFRIEQDGSLSLRETLTLTCAPGRGVRHPSGRSLLFACERSMLVVTLDADGNIVTHATVPAQNFSVAEPVVAADGICVATNVPNMSSNRFHSWSFSVTAGTLTYIHVTPLATPAGTASLAAHPTLPILFVGVGAQLYPAAILAGCEHPQSTPTPIAAVANLSTLLVDAGTRRLFAGGDGLRIYDIATASGLPSQIGSADLPARAVALALDPAAPDRLYIASSAGIALATFAAGTLAVGAALPVGPDPTSLVLAP